MYEALASGFPSNLGHGCWYQKTSIPALRDGVNGIILRLLLSTHYKRVTDRQTDGRTDGHAANTCVAERHNKWYNIIGMWGRGRWLCSVRNLGSKSEVVLRVETSADVRDVRRWWRRRIVITSWPRCVAVEISCLASAVVNDSTNSRLADTFDRSSQLSTTYTKPALFIGLVISRCLSVCLFICLSVCLSVCIRVCLSLRLA